MRRVYYDYQLLYMSEFPSCSGAAWLARYAAAACKSTLHFVAHPLLLWIILFVAHLFLWLIPFVAHPVLWLIPFVAHLFSWLILFVDQTITLEQMAELCTKFGRVEKISEDLRLIERPQDSRLTPLCLRFRFPKCFSRF